MGCKKVKTDESIVKSVSPTNEERYNVAFLIMDGTFNTEFTAPYNISTFEIPKKHKEDEHLYRGEYFGTHYHI